jgi:hypothetical protein
VPSPKVRPVAQLSQEFAHMKLDNVLKKSAHEKKG